ncbi:MAG: NADP-dependent oxidoreductase [Acidobacteria bacterium]|nr:NADP-dependent oxidoreductase [Acidobacteriota bacterium]
MPRALIFKEYGGPEHSAVADVAKPSPGAGQLLVAVKAAGVNPVDWKTREGLLRDFRPLDLPAVLGREASGLVEAVGPGVTGFAPGDEVFGATADAGFSEYALLDAEASAPKPAGLSFAAAATLPICGVTAYNAVAHVHPEAGDVVVVTGAAGGVGVVVVQLLHDRGVRVIGTASEPKHAFVEKLGAEPVAYGEGVRERIEALAPAGVTAIIDTVGGDALRDVAPLLADGSRLVTVADPTAAGEFGGSMVSRHRPTTTLIELADLVVRGALDPNITATYPLERAADALAEVQTGHVTGKVVITVP